MIFAPPVDNGESHDTVTDVEAGTTDKDNGTDGRVNGVAVVVNDALPGPAAFTARIRTEYVVPLVNEDVPSLDNVVITMGLAVVPKERFLHVTPPSVEY